MGLCYNETSNFKGDSYMAKKAYARPQHKVKPLTIVIVVGILFVFAALIAVLIPSDKEKIYNAYKSAGSPNLQEDHVFESISGTKLMKVIDGDQPLIVFFGNTSCSVCVTEIGFYDIEFQAFGLEDTLKRIYYVNTTTLSAETVKKLQDVYQFKLEGTPELYYVNEGEIVLNRKDVSGDTQAAQIREFMRQVDEAN